MPEELKKSFNSYQKMKESFLKNANRVVWFLGTHAFLAILLSFLLSLCFGGVLLLRHASLLDRGSETINSPVKFKEDVFRAVLKARQDRQDFFESPAGQIYHDPFQ